MKIALCLFGILGGKSGRNGAGGLIHPSMGKSSYDKNLFAGNDVDVFIHSWSKDQEDIILETYNPKSYLIEEQEMFENVSMKDYGFENLQELIKTKGNKIVYDAHTKQGKSDKDMEDFFNALIFRSNSRWKSTQKSIQLKKKYEEENRFKYDFVIASRFDIGLNKKINFEALDPDIMYTSYRLGRVDQNEAFYDIMFMSGSENMDKFGDLYNHIFETPIRPPWASKYHVDRLGLKHQHYFTDSVDYTILRRKL